MESNARTFRARRSLPRISFARPQLPGYVAVSATVLDGVYLNEAGRAFYKPLRERPPRAVIGYSISCTGWTGRGGKNGRNDYSGSSS